MRHKDESIQTVLLKFINKYFEQNNTSPSLKMISAETGLATTTIHRYLLAMKEEGKIEYNGRRSIVTAQMAKTIPACCLPFLSKITGNPSDFEEDNIVSYGRMSTLWGGDGECFLFVTDAPDIEDANILAWDHVIVRKDDAAKIGDIVVAICDDGKPWLRKLCFDENKQQHYLRACTADQEAYPPVYVSEVRIVGVAVMGTHAFPALFETPEEDIAG